LRDINAQSGEKPEQHHADQCHNGEVERGIAPAERDPCGDDEKAISGERGRSRRDERRLQA
jgi:hypothetical protein